MDILVIDDEKLIREATMQIVEDAGHYAESANNSQTALEAIKESSFDLLLLDVNLGRENGLDLLEEILKRNAQLPVVVFTAAANISLAVEAMRRGALDFLEKPFTATQLGLVITRAQKHRKLAERVVELQTQVASHSPEPVFDSSTPAMKETLDVLFRAAPTPASILILGESGTGKSVVARAVHHRSDRASKPFVTVNCPSLSRELLESELFGHMRGAFTGAVKDQWGKVKAADGGTLFLDEIGELPLEIQPKLLRLLQDREYERLGESTTRPANVRIVAATNRDLTKAVADGTFREDLFYRLNVITVTMPPLRHRQEDVLRFSEEYLKFFAKQCARPVPVFSDEARRRVMAYPWPGNLRELRNVIERVVILAGGREIKLSDLPASLNGTAVAGEKTSDGPNNGDWVSLDELEAAHIRAILACTQSLAEAASVLGIDQATLYRKRKKLGLDAEQAA
ncbi:MAG TPA: sigma-54 dependent transcriptional regulator [Verrucomicrobium sp.]|nr:sigma-54 dependent transcriptional regulator [Verrucomicrobium sp.]